MILENKAQEEAIHTVDGQMLIIACPGSGKTTTLLRRINYMVTEANINPTGILMITFTKAAADEMNKRYISMFGENPGITFSTIHALCFDIVKKYGKKRVDIITEIEVYNYFNFRVRYIDQINDKDEFVADLILDISVMKNNMLSLSEYQPKCTEDKELFSNLYTGYEEYKDKESKIDFDDMLVMAKEILDTNPEILLYLRSSYPYIQVDEYQDTNYIQRDIVYSLAGENGNLAVVGDDDQSIYHFRGARPEIMLNFTRDYPEAETVLLDVNYRCSSRILSSAMKVISVNKKRFSKKLSTPNPQGDAILVREFQNPREEYMQVVSELRDRLEKEERLEDTAILLRTNQEAEGLVGALMERQIPFYMKEKLPNLFHHWICRNLLAYMHMAKGDRSRQNFLEIMNRPNRYISRDALPMTDISFEALKEYYKDKDWMCDRITTLETHLKILKGLSPYAAVNFIRKGMGYEEYLHEYAEYRKIKPEELSEILDRLTESTRGMDSLEQWENYIEEYSRKLEEQARKQEQEREGVLLSTLHGVKGLEFDKVYILNVNEGSMPYRKAVLEPAIEEERRLFYVGMTRARKQLTLCYVRQQYEKKREPSRFLKEAGI